MKGNNKRFVQSKVPEESNIGKQQKRQRHQLITLTIIAEVAIRYMVTLLTKLYFLTKSDGD